MIMNQSIISRVHDDDMMMKNNEEGHHDKWRDKGSGVGGVGRGMVFIGHLDGLERLICVPCVDPHVSFHVQHLPDVSHEEQPTFVVMASRI